MPGGTCPVAFGVALGTDASTDSALAGGPWDVGVPEGVAVGDGSMSTLHMRGVVTVVVSAFWLLRSCGSAAGSAGLSSCAEVLWRGVNAARGTSDAYGSSGVCVGGVLGGGG